MIPLYKIFMPEELPELKNILYSGALAYGRWGKEFEREAGDFIGNEKFLAVNSYNSAMLIAITTLELKPGDEVIASPMSCLASNQPLITQGLRVIWADIDPATGTLDPADVEKKISKKTRAIFHNHHCGYIGYIDEINSVAKRNSLFVIDDAIEAFASEYKGKKIGNLGSDITVFSFQTVRLPNTIDGGGLSFNNDEMYKKASLIRDLGVDRSKFRDDKGEISAECDITLPGFGATLSDFNSYIGLMQLKDIPGLLSKQRINAKTWNNVIKKHNSLVPLKLVKQTNPNYWVYGCLSLTKVKDIAELRRKGIYASGVHLNNNLYSVFNEKTNLKGVSEFYNKFIALPCGWWVNKLIN